MKVLVTGGASSGKSAWAEGVALSLPTPHVYVATMEPYGDEAAARIAHHRELRAGKGFVTVERPRDFAGLTLPSEAAEGTVLLEDLGNLVANELFVDGREIPAEEALETVDRGLSALESRCANLVVVTNEIGSDAGAYGEGTRAYQRLLGSIACRLAARFDVVAECVFGIPQVVKGELLGADASSETPRSASSPSARALRSSPMKEEESVQRVSSEASAPARTPDSSSETPRPASSPSQTTGVCGRVACEEAMA